MQIIDGVKVYDIGNVSGGVQSTTMARAALAGLLPMPDCFIFADTGWERATSYQTIHELKAIVEEAGVPFHIVNNGNIRAQAIESGNPNSTYPDWRDEHGYAFLKMPVFTIDQRGNRPRMSKKQCTTDFKIKPIRKFLRSHYGEDTRFNQWIGISLDESQRMRTSDVKYARLCYPLIYELKWTRGHCIEWLKSQNIAIPSKSACIGCPLHSDENWHELSEAEKADAIDFDESIRDLQAHVDALPKPKKIPEGQLTLIDMDEVDEWIALHPLERRQDVQLFVHSSGVPLKKILSGEIDPSEMWVQEEFIDREEARQDAASCELNCFI